MMSMDDVFERMQWFAQVLKRFQDSLDASLAELGRRHDDVDPHWQDERRRAYDAQYTPLHDTLMKYVRQQGPEYIRFLEERIQAIDQYLHG
jgi:uncharacterized protein YukE